VCPLIPPDKDWIDLLGALLTPMVGAVGIYIAIQQRAINKNRLKHELFEKRYQVYENIGAFIGTVLMEGRVQAGSEYQFLRDTKAVTLLFDETIKEFTSEIYKRAVDLHCLDTELESLDGSARTENIQKQRAIKDWHEEQLRSMELKFLKYLKLEH
jgi:tRNA A-37 threonylcarbamoyl transferase component Bud32